MVKHLYPNLLRGVPDGWSITTSDSLVVGAIWRMEYPQSNPNLWDIMPDSTDVDWGNIISIVLSLVAILFTFDAISSEKEHGTLRLTLSNSISRGTVLVSKFLAALITISIPFLIAALINLFLLYTSGSIVLRSSEWLRLGVIVFIAVVFVSIFLAFGAAHIFSCEQLVDESYDSFTDLGCLGGLIAFYAGRAYQRFTADDDE